MKSVVSSTILACAVALGIAPSQGAMANSRDLLATPIPITACTMFSPVNLSPNDGWESAALFVLSGFTQPPFGKNVSFLCGLPVNNVEESTKTQMPTPSLLSACSIKMQMAVSRHNIGASGP